MATPAKVRRLFTVDSGMVHKLGFDHETPGVDRGLLAVQFKNFDVYIYENVTWSDYLQLMNASSIGAAFHTLIKDKYKSQKLSTGATKDAHLVDPVEVRISAPVVKGEEIPMLDTFDSTKERPRRKK